MKKLRINNKWKLALRVIPFLVVIVLLKFIVHYWGIEFLTLNGLFTAIISANIFLIGFLISGTLVDYKESEKIPGEMACSLESIADEALLIIEKDKSIKAREMLIAIQDLNNTLLKWFYKKSRTQDIMHKISSLNAHFVAIADLTQPNFIARLKQEQNVFRKYITRAHTIRETSFLGTGYAIAEIISFVLIFGLIFIKMEPYYESIFFVIFVSFILIYMIFFIKDLDNPFGYYEDNLVEEISLKPLIELKDRLEKYTSVNK